MVLTRFLVIAGGLLLSSSAANAHPFHASTTELEWNGKSQRFEVAMKLRIVDLEDAISAQQGLRFRIEHSPDVKQRLQEYLQKHFAITMEGRPATRLHWVGHELELHDVWIYFEAEAVEDVKVAVVADAREVTKKRRLTWDDLIARQGTRDSNAESEQLAGLHIRNSMLTEIQPEQENLVVLTHGRRVVSVTLTGETPERATATE